jgi:APA family basic amino acid/polyamine antiporter
MGAALPVLFAYSGFTYLNNLAGEVRDPQRTLPRALLLGMLLVIVAYVLVNVAYLAVLGHAGLAPAARRGGRDAARFSARSAPS